MANHYRVSPKYWLKARKRGWNDQQVTLGLYLLTCDHRNLEGLYRLPKPYVAADLGWPARKVEETLASICADGFAMYDEDAEMVLIPNALKHQSPSTTNQIKGAMAQLERIPKTTLWHAFRIACASHAHGLADAIAEKWPCDGDGPSHAHAGSPARASSSSSTSISSSNSTSTETLASEGESRSIVAGRLFLYWQKTCNHEQAKFTADRKSKAEARLRDGYTEQYIREAIDGAARAPFTNPEGKVFDDFELICRSGSKLEDFHERTAPATGQAAPAVPAEFAKYDIAGRRSKRTDQNEAA